MILILIKNKLLAAVKEFDFDQYQFYDSSTMYKIKYITDEYIKQGKLNSDKIRTVIIHSIYDVVMK